MEENRPVRVQFQCNVAEQLYRELGKSWGSLEMAQVFSDIRDDMFF